MFEGTHRVAQLANEESERLVMAVWQSESKP